jgi:hypothetical protein
LTEQHLKKTEDDYEKIKDELSALLKKEKPTEKEK